MVREKLFSKTLDKSAVFQDRTESIPTWKEGAPPLMRILQKGFFTREP